MPVIRPIYSGFFPLCRWSCSGGFLSSSGVLCSGGPVSVGAVSGPGPGPGRGPGRGRRCPDNHMHAHTYARTRTRTGIFRP